MGYWPDHFIEGSVLDLSHLEPLPLRFHNGKLGRHLHVDVKFTNHCFTEEFKDGVHHPATRIMDGIRARAFDRRRYHLSKKLPELVNALPSSSVWQTPEQNFSYFIEISAAGEHYQMFFRLKKVRSEFDLSMTVESAYPNDFVAERRKSYSKVHFQVLCANVFQGRNVKYHAKR